MDSFATLTTQFHGKLATTAVCRKAGENLIPGDAKARMVDVSKLFLVHKLWWSFSRTKARTTTETYRWITDVTGAWTSENKKTAAGITRQWIRAACTHSVVSESRSGLAITIQPGPRDAPSMQWAA
jgi:hypothetical protein